MYSLRCPNLRGVAFLFSTRWRHLTIVLRWADGLSYGCWRLVALIGVSGRLRGLALLYRSRDLAWLVDIRELRHIVPAAL